MVLKNDPVLCLEGKYMKNEELFLTILSICVLGYTTEFSCLYIPHGFVVASKYRIICLCF